MTTRFEARDHRSPLAWLGHWGIGLLSWFAPQEDGGGGAGPQNYGDPGGDSFDDKCCFLARPDKECPYSGGDKSNYTCNPGFQKTYWFCCEGTQQVGCGECSSGPSCYDPPWDCSIWWWADCRC